MSRNSTSGTPVHSGGRGRGATAVGQTPPPPPYGRSPTGSPMPPGTPKAKGYRPPSPDYATTISQSALVPTGGAPPHPPTVVVGHQRAASPPGVAAGHPTSPYAPPQHYGGALPPQGTGYSPTLGATQPPAGYAPTSPHQNPAYYHQPPVAPAPSSYAPPPGATYGGGDAYSGATAGYGSYGAVPPQHHHQHHYSAQEPGPTGYQPAEVPPPSTGADPFQFMRAPLPQDGQYSSSKGANDNTSPTVTVRSKRGKPQRNNGEATPNNNSMVGFTPEVIAYNESKGSNGPFGVVNTSFGGHSSIGETISDTDSLHSGTSSMVSGSSIRDDLPLCPHDGDCPNINDRLHQRQFAHTCRLFPCYHGNLKYHAKLFRHEPGQCVDAPHSNGSTPNATNLGENGEKEISTRQRRRIRKSLKSVNFSYISPNVPNAVTISVTCPKMKGDVAYDIAGDWTQVKLHSFKRYLHQVFNVPPAQQTLMLDYTNEMDDDLATVAELGVVSGSSIHIAVKDTDGPNATELTANGIGPVVAGGATPKTTPSSSVSSPRATTRVKGPVAHVDTTKPPTQQTVAPPAPSSTAGPTKKTGEMRGKISLDDL